MVFVKLSVLACCLFGGLAQAMLPINIKSHRFIKPASPDNDPSQNHVFFIKGIDYQTGGSSAYDPASGKDILSDAKVCARDAAVFQDLGVNAIGIYSLNPDINHDECMTIFNNAGIYVILHVNSALGGESLNRADPAGSYNGHYLSRVFRFIEAFKNYPNVLGFFAGNEVINESHGSPSTVPQYIRAVQRDMKQYIKNHSNRTIPVGYSAADIIELRLPTLHYMQCNSRDGKFIDHDLQESRSDLVGWNSYEWCSGTSDWKSSGYDKLNSTASDVTIPLLLSEYGCNKVSPRTFDEVTDGLYKGLLDNFCGGLVYEYSYEANKFGIVRIGNDGNIQYTEDFDNLKKRFQELNLPNITESSVANRTIYKCSASDITSEFSSFGVKNFTIPSQPSDISRMIEKGLNHTNIGSIIKDYRAPTTIDYTVIDHKGNRVPATISYNPENLQNNLGTSTSVSVAQTSPDSTATQSSTASTRTKNAANPASPTAAVAAAALFAAVAALY